MWHSCWDRGHLEGKILQYIIDYEMDSEGMMSACNVNGHADFNLSYVGGGVHAPLSLPRAWSTALY